MNIINFGNWDKELHKDYKQIKRIISTQTIKSENITVNVDAKTAKIIGKSDTHDVTLNSCTCFDFESRKLPCKHIYRLAYELNYIDELPKINRKASKEFKDNLSNEIDKYKNLYLSGAISGEKFNKIVNALTSK